MASLSSSCPGRYWNRPWRDCVKQLAPAHQGSAGDVMPLRDETPATPGMPEGAGAIVERSHTLACNASRTASMTSAHWKCVDCRNRRIDGYQAVTSLVRPQRQSAARGSKVHTGLPSAPARCATEVSTEITRSRHAIAAAVSA